MQGFGATFHWIIVPRLHFYLQLGGPSRKGVLITAKPFQRNVVRACVHMRERRRRRGGGGGRIGFNLFFFHSGTTIVILTAVIMVIAGKSWWFLSCIYHMHYQTLGVT